MYTLPLQDMTADQMLAARDSVMKINIPGGKEGQWAGERVEERWVDGLGGS